jgi:hypothetical protein
MDHDHDIAGQAISHCVDRPRRGLGKLRRALYMGIPDQPSIGGEPPFAGVILKDFSSRPPPKIAYAPGNARRDGLKTGA